MRLITGWWKYHYWPEYAQARVNQQFSCWSDECWLEQRKE